MFIGCIETSSVQIRVIDEDKKSILTNAIAYYDNGHKKATAGIDSVIKIVTKDEQNVIIKCPGYLQSSFKLNKDVREYTVLLTTAK